MLTQNQKLVSTHFIFLFLRRISNNIKNTTQTHKQSFGHSQIASQFPSAFWQQKSREQILIQMIIHMVIILQQKKKNKKIGQSHQLAKKFQKNQLLLTAGTGQCFGKFPPSF